MFELIDTNIDDVAPLDEATGCDACQACRWYVAADLVQGARLGDRSADMDAKHDHWLLATLAQSDNEVTFK